MTLRTISFAALVASLSVVAQAADLPQNYVITQQTNRVEIFAVKSAQIVKPKIQKTETPKGTYVNFEGVLELNLTVQGNLCTAKPEDVSYLMTPISAYKMNFELIAASDNHAYSDTLYACTAHGVIAETKVAFKLRYFVQNQQEFKQTYVISTREMFGPGRKTATVVVSFSGANVFKVDVQQAP
jgi:hypothetical protein